MQNQLIIVEGCDGAGKTTMIKSLKEALLKKNKKLKIKTLALPYSTGFGYKKIRDILSSKSNVVYPPDVVQSIFVANMIECNVRSIDPFFEDSEEDHILILDRYIFSTIIYNALLGGTIFDSIQRFTLKTYFNITQECMDPTTIDFDIISKLYGQLNKPLDLVVFLIPPMDIILEHAKERKGNETNDQEQMVKRSWFAYSEMAEFVTGHMRRTVIDTIESPNGMLRPDIDSYGNYLILNDWNRNIDEAANYENYKNAILAKLNL